MQLMKNHCLSATDLQKPFSAFRTTYDWSPHSPYLNSLDFWLWGAAKGSVFANKPGNLIQLELNVTKLHPATPTGETLVKVGQYLE